MTKIKLYFGIDQQFIIDKILPELKQENHVNSWNKTVMNSETVEYEIEFFNEFGPYYMGHKQASFLMQNKIF